jgi:hypothetical protein
MQSFSLDESERPRNWLRARPSRTAARSRAAVRRFRTAVQGCRAAVQPRTAAQPRSRLVIDIAYPLGTFRSLGECGRRKPAASEGGQDTSRTRRIWQAFPLLCQSVNLSVHHWPRPVDEPGPVEA